MCNHVLWLWVFMWVCFQPQTRIDWCTNMAFQPHQVSGEYPLIIPHVAANPADLQSHNDIPLQGNPSIHSANNFLLLIQFRVAGQLGPIPAIRTQKAGQQIASGSRNSKRISPRKSSLKYNTTPENGKSVPQNCIVRTTSQYQHARSVSKLSPLQMDVQNFMSF